MRPPIPRPIIITVVPVGSGAVSCGTVIFGWIWSSTGTEKDDDDL